MLPDDESLPTGEDLASGRDPVLAHALATDGMQVSAEATGKMFPTIWTKL